MPRGALCRADLLRHLALTSAKELPVDQTREAWFGYVATRSAERGAKFEVAPSTLTSKPSQEAQTSQKTGPLQQSRMLMAVSRDILRPAEVVARFEPPVEGLQPGDLEPPVPGRTVDFEHLVPQARLVPALRRMVGTRHARDLDVNKLVDGVAQMRLPAQLPRKQVRRWPSQLTVLLDGSERLMPYQWDMKQLATSLNALMPSSHLSQRMFRGQPGGQWQDWLAWQHAGPGRFAGTQPRPWSQPPTGSDVLVVSDFGLFGGAALAQVWASFLRGLLHAGLRVIALTPLSAAQLASVVPAEIPVLRWSPDSPMRATRRRVAPEVAWSACRGPLEELLGKLSVPCRVDPPLLRALRKRLQMAPGNAALEGMAWAHADFCVAPGGWYGTMRAAAAQTRRARLPDPVVTETWREASEHHHHLESPLNHEEALAAAAYAPDALAHDSALSASADAARVFIGRVATSLAREGQGNLQTWAIARDFVGRAAADRRLKEQYAPELTAITKAMAEHGAKSLPEDFDLSAVEQQVDDIAYSPVELVLDLAAGEVLLQHAEKKRGHQASLAAPLSVGSWGAKLRRDAFGGAPVERVHTLPHVVAGRAALEPSAAPLECWIETAQERLTLATVDRPLGVQSWYRDKNGLVVVSQPFGRHQVQWREDDGTLSVVRAPNASPGEPQWRITGRAKRVLPTPRWVAEAGTRQTSVEVELDESYGVLARLEVTTEHGTASQRLRWVGPGEFTMGSPDDEPGRYEVEGPPHRVTLTQGFWLFDTPCTQALWLAVMGDNPSEFKHPNRPVEQVSWEDAQAFIERLNRLVPELELALPTEAQWEYACRAGTKTALYSGPIDILGKNNAPALDDIAWYGGNSSQDYDLESGSSTDGWPEKQYPGGTAGTRIVAQKEPNDLGLYDMLGNVWEWCRDTMRNYNAKSIKDPMGADELDESRVVRGGSWNNLAGGLRSAFRDADPPGIRSDVLGFRCARVQAQLEQEAPQADDPNGDPPQ